jgi:SagB-type dehydrogenase family enzyme
MPPRIDQELGRYFLQDTIRTEVDFTQTGQSRRLPAPPIEQPCPEEARRVALPKPGAWRGIAPVTVEAAIGRRESRRGFKATPLTLDELAFLLWATQGVRRQLSPAVALRTVPSAGARHAFETRLAVLSVEGLVPGLYRYLALTHELVAESAVPDLGPTLADAAHGQAFVGQAAVVFVWTARPERMEWRYAEASYKVIAVDAGHVCQNLYLACECIGAGTCAVAAYRQDRMDQLLGVDGKDEFTVYLAPVGKV